MTVLENQFYLGKLTQKIGLKYAPEIRFYKDRMAEDYQDHKKSLERLSNPQQADKEFDQEFISENGAKKPLSFEQQEKINTWHLLVFLFTITKLVVLL